MTTTYPTGHILEGHRNPFAPPFQTIQVMQSILDSTLEKLADLESDISELETDLRYSHNGWHEDATILKLTAARADQSRMVVQAARDLRTVEQLRERAGMEPTTLGRIVAEFNKGNAK